MAILKKMIIFTAFLCGFVGGAFAQSLKSESIYLICKGKVTYLYENFSGKIEANTYDEEEAITLITSNSNGRKTNALKFKGTFYDERYYSHEDQPTKPMMWGQVDFTPEEIRVRRDHSIELPVKNIKKDDFAMNSEFTFKINRLTGNYEFREVHKNEYRDGRKTKNSFNRTGYCEKKDQKF